MTVIKSKLKLVEITIYMLQGDLMIRANDRSLEKTPHVLKGVCVSEAAHVLAFAVINRNGIVLSSLILSA